MEFGLYPAALQQRSKIYSFGGLNRTRKGGRNEFEDMYNMSSDEYPCIAPCGGNLKIAEANTKINAVAAPDITNTEEVSGITGVFDGGFYYNGVLKSSKFKLRGGWAWQIEQKGNMYIINGYDANNKKSQIFYYNIDTNEFAEGGTVMRNLIVTCGTNYLRTVYDDNYDVNYYTVTTPNGEVIKNSDFFLDYRDYTTYDNNGNTTMIYSKNVFQKYFKVGDEITIEGFPAENNNGQIWNVQSGAVMPQPGITAARNNTIDTDNMSSTDSLHNTAICRAVVTSFLVRSTSGGRAAHEIYFKLYNKNGEEVSFRTLDSSYMFCSGVTLKKRTRVFDNITVHQGRIWGSIPSGNQLYASSSDDIFSFTSDDIINKYGARIPSDTPGTFTALCSYNNELVAFKKDSITIVSGTNPVNYNSFVINGVGCIAPKSVAVTPNGIIFLSYNGFYIYNGAVPQCISSKLNTSYSAAVAGFDGNTYYTCVLKGDGDYEFLTYSLRYGVWHKGADIDAVGFFRFKNNFYAADASALYKLGAANVGDWFMMFMRNHDNNLDNKGINEIWVRAEISEGAEFWLETISNDGTVEKHKVFSEPGLNIFRCPVRLKMSDSYQIKVCGSGKVVIYELELHKPDGGRMYKDYE